MKPWLQHASSLLTSSLTPPQNECNELDWKVALSEDKSRLAEHLCAFANHPGGGCLVFGVAPNASISGITLQEIETVVNKLTNLGRDAVEPAIRIDHEGITLDGKTFYSFTFMNRIGSLFIVELDRRTNLTSVLGGPLDRQAAKKSDT